MNCVKLFPFCLVFFFLAFNFCYPQSVHFVQLGNGQVRSDFYNHELVRIPTNYTYSETPGQMLSFGHYVRLIVWTSDGTQIGDYNDLGENSIPDLLVGPGVYRLLLIFYEMLMGANGFYPTAACEITIEEKYLLNVRNNIIGEQVYIDNQLTYSGASCIKGLNEQVTVSVDDIAGTDYDYTWNESGTNKSCWLRRGYNDSAPSRLPGGESRNFIYQVKYGDNRATLHSDLRKACNISITNNFSGCSNKGSILINDIPKSSPYNDIILSGEQLKATAIDYEDNGMHYVFSHWENGSTSPTRYISVDSHSNYTAYFVGTPIYMSTFRDLSVSNSRGEHLVLNWTEHPNPLVTSYKIHRKVLKPPLADEITQIGQVPRGTLTFTDYDYYNYGTKYQDMLFYDVSAFCDSEKTSSEIIWCGLYYGTLIKGSDSTKMSKSEKEQTLENKLSNYPNPFNPSTQIRYSLKEGGMVALQIYDILGNKVADLINKYQPAGTYYINFDGADKPTGIYICSIKSNNYSETKKLLLIK